MDQNPKKHFPTDTARNTVTDLHSINTCITDGENQNLFHAAKYLLEWNFQFGHQNLHDTQIIWSPPFGTDGFVFYSYMTFEELPKYEAYQYAKAKRIDLHRKKTHIDVSHDGYL